MSKVPGPDDLSAALLRSCRHEIVEVVTFMFNAIVNVGTIPEQWKGANIVPIPKVSHPDGPNDFRGINLISSLGKAFERILRHHEKTATGKRFLKECSFYRGWRDANAR